MKRKFVFAAALAVALPSAASTARAHAVCGDRVFPATLVMDDPGVGDELSLPTVQYARLPASGGNPSGSTVTYGYEWDKTITEHFGFAINGDYLTQHGLTGNQDGWDDISLTLKDEFLCSDGNEFMASVGVVRQFGNTGSASVNDPVSFTQPTVYVGKGLGDLPIGYFRPLAITGELGYQRSDSPAAEASQWNYSASLQYSIPYLQQHVKDLGLPQFIAGMTPLVEVSLSKPTGGQTTGTISPGILYDGDTWQVGVEAVLPANTPSWASNGVGAIVQFHLFLDDIFPDSLGKPLF